MKNRTFLVSFIMVFALALTLSSVIAEETVDVTINDIIVDGISIVDNGTASISVSDTVPVIVEFTANENASDVKIKVYIEGYKYDVSDSVVLNTPIEEGITYRKRFNLELPSSMDFDEFSKDVSLLIRISADNRGSLETSYNLKLQKDLYSLNILSVETSQEIVAGMSSVFDIVLQNDGYERLDRVYVKLSIPDLNLEKIVYFGDLSSTAENSYDDLMDTINRKVYLTMPQSTIPGIYNVIIEAYNYDVSTTISKKIVVKDIERNVLPTTTSRTISSDNLETIFELVLVNPTDRVVVYSIIPGKMNFKGLILEITEPIVTLPPQSSRNVKIKVRATKNIDAGTHIIALDIIDQETGLIVKQTNFTLNVEDIDKDNLILVFTIILGFIFIILLVVLIVLLSKRPLKSKDLEETNYY